MKSVTKTKKTLSKNNSSNNGLSNKELLEQLSLNISLAKGLLATLSTNDPSVWTEKCQTTTAREHSRILLQEVMDEIWSAESTLSILSEKLKKSYMGICLH